jgi:hypothetical protein
VGKERWRHPFLGISLVKARKRGEEIKKSLKYLTNRTEKYTKEEYP